MCHCVAKTIVVHVHQVQAIYGIVGKPQKGVAAQCELRHQQTAV